MAAAWLATQVALLWLRGEDHAAQHRRGCSAPGVWHTGCRGVSRPEPIAGSQPPIHAGLIAGQPATAHPGFSDKLSNQEAVPDRVVASGKLVTSRGPGTSLEFALRLVEELFGRAKAEEVASPMVLPAGWHKALS